MCRCLCGITGRSPDERIDSPRDSRNRHQARAQWVGRGHARRHQVHETGDCERQPDPGHGREVLAGAQRDDKHRQLHRAKQHQRARPGTQGQVSKREEHHIQVQRHHRAPVRFRPYLAGAQRQDDTENNGTGHRSDRGEARRIDEPGAQSEPAKHGVGRKRDHRRCGQGNRIRFHQRFVFLQE